LRYEKSDSTAQESVIWDDRAISHVWHKWCPHQSFWIHGAVHRPHVVRSECKSQAKSTEDSTVSEMCLVDTMFNWLFDINQSSRWALSTL